MSKITITSHKEEPLKFVAGELYSFIYAKGDMPITGLVVYDHTDGYFCFVPITIPSSVCCGGAPFKIWKNIEKSCGEFKRFYGKLEIESVP